MSIAWDQDRRAKFQRRQLTRFVGNAVSFVLSIFSKFKFWR